MTFKAAKVVIITEKVILEQVAQIIESLGATGYTVFAAGGKGSRGVRPAGRAAVVDGFSNVQIEVITATHETAEKIAVEVADRFFQNYSGITYLEDVEILRSHKF
jgi:nitrogen regulatory protein PII|tara:strand:- start:26797 stop:27111 length:315 start_codon:yes stop_codon:yes gene_type:complete